MVKFAVEATNDREQWEMETQYFNSPQIESSWHVICRSSSLFGRYNVPNAQVHPTSRYKNEKNVEYFRRPNLIRESLLRT